MSLAPSNLSTSVGFVDITDKDTQTKFQSNYPFPVCDPELYDKLKEIDPRLVDPLWRINNLYFIIDKKGKLCRFRLKPLQLKLLLKLHNRNVVLKARQHGITTEICVIAIDLLLFNSFKQCGIVAHTQPDAKTIFKKIKLMWEKFPEELKELLNLQTVGDSKSELELSNGSQFRVATSLRSGTYNLVLVSEFGKTSVAFPEKAEEIVTGTFPTVENGVLVIESTAEGGGEGRFFDICDTAQIAERRNLPLTKKDFKFFFFAWFENPEYQMPITTPVEIDQKTVDYFNQLQNENHIYLTNEQKLWYYMEQQTQKDKMKREYPSTPEEAFITSGNKLFSVVEIERARQYVQTIPMMVTPEGVKIFKAFQRGHVYGIGADVSQGIGRDSSAACVIDFTDNEVAATYRNENISPTNFAQILAMMGHLYGTCVVAPESNQVGVTTCTELNAIYPKIYMQKRIGYGEDKATDKLGWLATSASRPKAAYELYQAISDGELKVLDVTILEEAKLYNKEDSLESDTSKKTTRHFDLFVATYIAWQLRIEAQRSKDVAEQKIFFEQRREHIRQKRPTMYR